MGGYAVPSGGTVCFGGTPGNVNRSSPTIGDCLSIAILMLDLLAGSISASTGPRGRSPSIRSTRRTRARTPATPHHRYDELISVSYTHPMSDRARKIRRSTSRGTPSYQLGHYEMIGD